MSITTHDAQVNEVVELFIHIAKCSSFELNILHVGDENDYFFLHALRSMTFYSCLFLT